MQHTPLLSYGVEATKKSTVSSGGFDKFSAYMFCTALTLGDFCFWRGIFVFSGDCFFCTGQNPDVADLRHDLITDKVALNSGEEEATYIC